MERAALLTPRGEMPGAATRAVPARLLLASAVSAAVVVAAPLLGQIRAALREAFPGGFVRIVGGAVGVAAALLLLAALRRVRERRALRYTVMAAAVAIAAAYSLATRTGIPHVDIVERVHFVEYGVITFLFYRAWRTNGDLSVFVLPALAAFLVGTLDEWLQWFVPNRVGEARDVLLNLVSIGCGLLFSAAVEPPFSLDAKPEPERPAASRPWARLAPSSGRVVRGLAATAVLVFAAFVDSVHVGHAVVDEEIGVFLSRASRDALLAHSADRAARWRAHPPTVLRRWSREDQYMDEGLWHIARRNALLSEGNHAEAWRENLVLEKYYAPVIDTPSYAVKTPARWSAAQRAEVSARAARLDVPFESIAHPHPIVAWPRPAYWAVVGLVVAGAAMPRPGARRPGGDSPS